VTCVALCDFCRASSFALSFLFCIATFDCVAASDCAVAAMWWHFFCIGLTDIIFVLRISRFIGVCIEEAPSNNRYLFAYQKKFCIFNPRV